MKKLLLAIFITFAATTIGSNLSAAHGAPARGENCCLTITKGVANAGLWTLCATLVIGGKICKGGCVVTKAGYDYVLCPVWDTKVGKFVITPIAAVVLWSLGNRFLGKPLQ